MAKLYDCDDVDLLIRKKTDGELDNISESQIQASLARIELGMEAFVVEQRELCKLIKELLSDNNVRCDIEGDSNSAISLVSAGAVEMVATPGSDVNGCRYMDPSSADTLAPNDAGIARVASEHTCRTSTGETDFVELARLASMSSCCQSTLDPSWPVSLPMRSELEAMCASGSRRYLSRRPVSFEMHDDQPRRCLILPASLFATMINMLGLLCLIWDLVLTPLQLTWDLNIEGWLLTIAVAIAFFWTAELIMSFRTAFYTPDGLLETRPRKIAINYIRHQFSIDIVILTCDWAIITARTVPRAARMVRAFKAIRVVRLFRVARLLSRQSFNKHIFTLRISLEVFDSIKIAAACLWLTHLMACAWFAIGSTDFSDTGLNWVKSTSINSALTFEEAHTAFQYSSSMQWTLTCMVSGSSDISPRNSIEQTFSCLCILMGLLGQAYAVSILSTSVIEKNARQRHLMTTTSSLQQFCSVHGVYTQLGLIARSQVRNFFLQSSHAALTLDKVEGLQIISKKLRTMILLQVFTPRLSCHSLLVFVSQADKHTLTKIMNDNIMHLMYVQMGHDVFTAGDTASRMYLLSKGTAHYTQEPESSLEQSTKIVDVSLDIWYCEPALWTQWFHVGTMEPTSKGCDLHCLMAEGFLQAASASPKLSRVLREYGAKYHQRITESVPPLAPWPSDVETYGTNFASLLIELTPSARQLVASLAVDSAVTMGILSEIDSEHLFEEVGQGKASFLLNKNASQVRLERVVSVLRVTVRSGEGRMFVELGKLSGDKVAMKCQLPGTKQRHTESIHATIARVVSRLTPVIGDIKLTDTSIEEAILESETTGLWTHYYFFDAFFEEARARSSTASEGGGGWAMTRRHSAKSAESLSSDVWRMLGRKPWLGMSQHTPHFTSKRCTLVDQLETRLNESTLMLTRSGDDSSETLCAWLNKAEFDFMRSEQGAVFAESFLNEDLLNAVRGNNSDSEDDDLKIEVVV